MKAYKRKLFIINRILIVLTLVFATYTLYELFQNQSHTTKLKKIIENTEIQIEQTEQSNKNILETIENGTTDEVIAAIARDRLDLVVPGERIIVDASGK